MSRFVGIDNDNEFFSEHYLDAVLAGDLKDVLGRWRDRGDDAPPRRLLALAADLFRHRERLTRLRDPVERARAHRDHTVALATALGWPVRPTARRLAAGFLPIIAEALRQDGTPLAWWIPVVPPHGDDSSTLACELVPALLEFFAPADEVGRAIWPVFEDYRHALETARLRESVDAMRDAAGLLERREVVLGYKAVVVDESQDMSTVAFRLLRQAVPSGPSDMFLVGDGHQRIYRRQVVLGQAGVHIVGRSRRLRVNYRTTDELRRAAVALLEGVRVDDLDGGTDTTAGYRSLVHGDPPQVVRCKTFDEEVTAIARFVKAGDLTRTCLAARTHQLVDQYAAALESRGVPVHRVARRKAEDRSAPGLRIATLHRVKGLEFDRVAIAGVNEGVVPLAAAVGQTDDAAVGEDAERQERALLYVGLTRARRAALVSSFGVPSPWLANLSR